MNKPKTVALFTLTIVMMSLVSCTSRSETLLIVSFWINHSEGGYEAVATFDTLSLSGELKERARERIEAEQKDPTIYRVDVVSTFGMRESHFTYATYYPPDTDVGESLADREIPIGSEAYIDPISIFVSDRTKRIELYIDDQLVHTHRSFDGKFSIDDFFVFESEAIVNDELVPGHEVAWSVDAKGSGEVWVTVEYRATRNSWNPLVLGSSELEGSMFFLPDHIQSTLRRLNLRITVTDGFSTETQVLEDVIDLQKKLELELSGFYENHFVGLHVDVDLWFVDPETGVGCDGRGCTFGENEGKYQVTWFSSVQNVCPSDIYEGTLGYVFKSEGTHRIGARVEHVENPALSNEVYVDVEVGPGDLGKTDTNPDCSGFDWSE